MTTVLAHAGLDVMTMFVWFGMFLLGILFIALAVRDEGRDEEAERARGSIRQIRDVNSLPLNHVREALRPPPAPRPASESQDRATPRHRHRPRQPHGPRLVR